MLNGTQGISNNNINNKGLQFIIASIVAFLCLLFLILARWLNALGSSVEGIVVIRDLMVSATAFIIGRMSSKS